MRFAIGEIVVDVVIDDDDFELPLVEFLPGLDLAALGQNRNVFEPGIYRRRPQCPEVRDPDLRAAAGGADFPRRHLHRRAQGPDGDIGLESAIGYGLPRSAAPGRRRPGFGRGRVLHSPSHRPCRLEHRARRWLLEPVNPVCSSVRFPRV
jgi:hypothetical protein